MSLRAFLAALLILCDPGHAASWREHQIAVGCTILDARAELVKTFPGRLCRFFPDGSYLTAVDATLKLVDKTNTTRWQLPAVAHHMLSLSHDKKRVLILDRGDYQDKGKTLKQDLFRVAALDGTILHENSAADLVKQAKQVGRGHRADELTHFNSFHEIPPLDLGLKLPDYARAGNFVLNARFMGVFFVSSDLKKVLHFMPLKDSHEHNTHDVQVLPSGKLLYFNNRAVGDTRGETFSTVEEMDLSTMEVQRLFSGEPRQIFFSPDGGSVQRLDQDHLPFTHQLAGTFLYSIPQKKILANLYKTHFAQGTFFPVQQARLEDLSAFLKFWK